MSHIFGDSDDWDIPPARDNVIDIPQPVPDPPADLRCRVYLLTIRLFLYGKIIPIAPGAPPWRKTFPFLAQDDDQAQQFAIQFNSMLVRAEDVFLNMELRRGLIDTTSEGNWTPGSRIAEWKNPDYKVTERKSEGGVILPGE